MKSILSILILSLFMVSNTMAAGVSPLQDKNASYTEPLLQDDNGKIPLFEVIVSGASFKNLQSSVDSCDNEKPGVEITKGEGTEVFLPADTPDFHQTRLYCTLYPFHSFL